MFRYLKPYPNAVSNGAAAGAARRGRAAPRRRPTAYLARRAPPSASVSHLPVEVRQ